MSTNEAGPGGAQVTGHGAPVSDVVRQAASELGKRNLGRRKTVTPERREALQEHMARVNEMRRERYAERIAKGTLVMGKKADPVRVAKGTLVKKLPNARRQIRTATVYNG